METLAPLSSPRFTFPDADTLSAVLTALIQEKEPSDGEIRVLRRVPNETWGHFPSEIVTCRLPDGSEQRLFCKYSAGLGGSSHGHRGGVSREVAVYRHLLRHLPLRTPVFYGAHRDPTTGDDWLILEYVAESPIGIDTLPRAARWIGSFHARNERLPTGLVPALQRYDREYYFGWVRRTLELAGPSHGLSSWLAPHRARFEDLFDSFLTLPPTVVHGEYYWKNVLVCGDGVAPLDWESAAIAAGEIDLAMLTEGGWPAETIRRCEREYRQSRWPEGAPARFEWALDVARIYCDFRWLGDRGEWERKRRERAQAARLKHLRLTSDRLGLI